MLLPWMAFLLLDTQPAILLGAALALVAFSLRLSVPRNAWLAWGLGAVCLCFATLTASSGRASISGLIYANLLPVALSLGLACLPAQVRLHTRGEYWGALSLSACFFMLIGLNLAPVAVPFAVLSAGWVICFVASARRRLLGNSASAAAWLTLLPAGLSLAAMALLYSYSEKQVNQLMRFFSAGGNVGLTFPAHNRLNSLERSQTNPSVVVRCYSQHPNRYLPARVYTDYLDLAWREADKSQQVRGKVTPPQFSFQLGQSPQGATVTERFEVHTSPIVLFAPRDTVTIEVPEAELSLLSGHLLELRGGSQELLAYSVTRSPEEPLAPPESADYLRHCLQLPELDPRVAATAARVMGKGSLEERCQRLCDWLQESYPYGFGHDWGNSQHPMEEFLFAQPKIPAHCELFASAMTLLARTQKIPTRYVNGFAVVEKSWDGDYWLVRVRNAHAWCEVWNGSRWLLFDATPTVAIEPGGDLMSRFDSFKEWLSHSWEAITNWGWREWLNALWARRAWFAAALIAAALWKLRGMRPWQLLRRSRRAAASKGPENRWMTQLTRALAPWKLERRPAETLEDWAERLGPDYGSAWVRDYAAWRYGGVGESAALESRLHQLLGELATAPRP